MRPRIAVLCLALLSSSGCTCIDWNLPEGYGPGYEIDSSRIGTGEQAIIPRTDVWYSNGEPMDYRDF